MTREEALQNLNLPPDAGPDEIENAYQRLVRRYPPEFHPDKFRTIDDSYRQLTSLAAMIEKLLSPRVEEEKFDPDLLAFEPSVPEGLVDKAIEEIRSLSLSAALWKKPTAEKGRADRGSATGKR